MPREIMGYKSYSLQEIVDMPNKPPLVKGLLYQHGKTIVVGKPKVGKSRLALGLGISLTEVKPILGLDVQPASVIYLEFDRRNLRLVIQELTQGQAINGMEVMPLSAIALNTKDGYELLANIVREFRRGKEGETVVMIDHKSVCFIGKENDDAPNRVWIGNLDKVAELFPVTYLVVCQAPKNWHGTIADLPIGSRILAAWADTIISLQPSGKTFRKLEVSGNYDELEPIIYNKQFQIVDKVSEETKTEQAIEAIRKIWGRLIYPDITKEVEKVAESVGCSYGIAWDAYREVKKEKTSGKSSIVAPKK